MKIKAGDVATLDTAINNAFTGALDVIFNHSSALIIGIVTTDIAKLKCTYIGDWEDAAEAQSILPSVIESFTYDETSFLRTFDLTEIAAAISSGTTDTHKKTGTDKIKKTGTVTNKTMAENSPIDASADYTITTPSAKGNAKAENDLEDLTTYNTTDAVTRKDPEYEIKRANFLRYFPSLYRALRSIYERIFDEFNKVY